MDIFSCTTLQEIVELGMEQARFASLIVLVLRRQAFMFRSFYPGDLISVESNDEQHSTKVSIMSIDRLDIHGLSLEFTSLCHQYNILVAATPLTCLQTFSLMIGLDVLLWFASCSYSSDT